MMGLIKFDDTGKLALSSTTMLKDIKPIYVLR
jgi:hypothetical protein